MKILNIAGYQFVELRNLLRLKEDLLKKCSDLYLKGTLLLSTEGININLAGIKENIYLFKDVIQKDIRFSSISFHETFSDFIPFKRLKIKIKKEIITFRQKNVSPLISRANVISPVLLKKWLDEKKEITLLDARNTYEVDFGTFQQALHLSLNDFCDLPKQIKMNSLDKNKPLVMFCTGGIRCEKAALFLNQQGFNEVFQLNGGILGYFNQVGRDHYQGQCFVFDEREAI